MKAKLVQLSPHQGAALRKIGFASPESLEAAHVRRLLQLKLIEWAGHAWRRAAAGDRRAS